MKVGYVGLGAMGKALARHLVGVEDLLVWDLNPQAMEDLVASGAKAATSLSDLGAGCEIIVLCLPKSANVEKALFGGGEVGSEEAGNAQVGNTEFAESGLAKAMASGTIVIDQTSGEPSKTREFAERLGQRGIRLIDAPVSGGVPSAVAGNITIMASGAEETFARALPVLRAISSNVFHCSDNVGDAQAVKAINNMVNSAHRVMTLEILAVGRWLGLDAVALTEALNSGPSRSFITGRLLPAIVEQRSSTDFALALMVKDLNQAADLGFNYQVPTPISETARGVVNAALSILGEEARLDDIVTFMERLMKTAFVGRLPAGGLAESPAEPHGVPMKESEALQLVVSALAAGNRLIMIENTALAIKMGMDVGNFAQVMLSGSATSAEAEALFASMAEQAELDSRTVGNLVDGLSRLARIGARCGIPMLMTNQVRVQCLRCANDIGGNASIDAMFKYFAPTLR